MNIINQNFGTVNGSVNNHVLDKFIIDKVVRITSIKSCEKSNTNADKRKQERKDVEQQEQENDNKIFDAILADKMQEEYCKKEHRIHVAPTNGECLKCGRNIYANYTDKSGIDVESAGKYQIIHCPFCDNSFFDLLDILKRIHKETEENENEKCVNARRKSKYYQRKK